MGDFAAGLRIRVEAFTMKRHILILAVLEQVATADPQLEPEQQDAAKAHFEKGKAHFEAHAYGLAVDEYIAAFRIAPFPELVFNIGQAYRLEGKDGPALEAYQMYLAQAPQGELADEARAHVLAFRSKGVVPATELSRADQRDDAVARDATLEHRRHIVLGADVARYDRGTNFAAVGGMSLRLAPKIVFEPRAMLGYKSGRDDVHGLDASGVSLSVHARLLAYPRPWLFLGGGIGAGVSSCSEPDTPVGVPTACSAGAFANLFLETGVLVSQRYELALRVHSSAFRESDALDAPKIGLMMAYHL